MATHAGFAFPSISDQIGLGLQAAGTSASSPHDTVYPENNLSEIYPAISDYGSVQDNDAVQRQTSSYSGYYADVFFSVWFNRIWIYPRNGELGDILSTQNVAIELYNAYLFETVSFTAIDNPITDGLTFEGYPTLPADITPRTGLSFTMVVPLSGDTSFEGTIVFETDEGDVTFFVSGNRAVMFPYIPEAPLQERLSWMTDVHRSLSGKEKRIALREFPRQSFKASYLREKATERNRMVNTLFGSQYREVSVPVWWEPIKITSDVGVGDTVINVETTDYVDLKVGGIAAMMNSEIEFNVSEIDAVGSTTVTLRKESSYAYPAGSFLYPVKPCIIAEGSDLKRFLRGLDSLDLSFLVTENNRSIADATGWPTYNSKTLLGSSSLSQSGTGSSFPLIRYILDGNTGKLEVGYVETVSDETFQLGFKSNSLQQLFNIRALLHDLRGQQKSFYACMGDADMVVTQQLLSATNTMTIEAQNYTRFVNGTGLRNRIRITTTSGTEIFRQITNSADNGDGTETLTLDSNWASTYDVEDIASVSLVQLSRLAEDEVVLDHIDALGTCHVIVNCVTVKDEL